MQTYVDGDAFRHVARCDCGWDGRRRWSRGSAELDAALHEVSRDHFEDAAREVHVAALMVLAAS